MQVRARPNSSLLQVNAADTMLATGDTAGRIVLSLLAEQIKAKLADLLRRSLFLTQFHSLE